MDTVTALASLRETLSPREVKHLEAGARDKRMQERKEVWEACEKTEIERRNQANEQAMREGT